MTPAARSLHLFGLYLCLLAPGLVLAPGPLLAPFAIAAPTELWVRVTGLLVQGAPAALLIFGAVDAAAALWTALALRRPRVLAM